MKHIYQVGKPNCLFASLAMATEDDRFLEYQLATENFSYIALANRFGYGLIPFIGCQIHEIQLSPVTIASALCQMELGLPCLAHLTIGHTIAFNISPEYTVNVYDKNSSNITKVSINDFSKIGIFYIEIVLPYTNELFKEIPL